MRNVPLATSMCRMPLRTPSKLSNCYLSTAAQVTPRRVPITTRAIMKTRPALSLRNFILTMRTCTTKHSARVSKIQVEQQTNLPRHDARQPRDRVVQGHLSPYCRPVVSIEVFPPPRTCRRGWRRTWLHDAKQNCQSAFLPTARSSPDLEPFWRTYRDSPGLWSQYWASPPLTTCEEGGEGKSRVRYGWYSSVVVQPAVDRRYRHGWTHGRGRASSYRRGVARVRGWRGGGRESGVHAHPFLPWAERVSEGEWTEWW